MTEGEQHEEPHPDDEVDEEDAAQRDVQQLDRVVEHVRGARLHLEPAEHAKDAVTNRVEHVGQKGANHRAYAVVLGEQMERYIFALTVSLLSGTKQ